VEKGVEAWQLLRKWRRVDGGEIKKGEGEVVELK
jgi:hypothetical protein